MVTEPLIKPCCRNTSLLNKCGSALFYRRRLNSTTIRSAAPFRNVELPSFRMVPRHCASLWGSGDLMHALISLLRLVRLAYLGSIHLRLLWDTPPTRFCIWNTSVKVVRMLVRGLLEMHWDFCNMVHLLCNCAIC
jgi:hypothetical protein